VARTTQSRREAATPRRGRFARGSTGQTQAPRRFARSGGQTLRRRRSQPEQSGAQKLMQVVRGVLPGGVGKRSAGRLLSARGGKGRGAGRGRKPAIFGALGAGAAGAAAAVVKRRQGSRSSQPAAGEISGVSEPQTTSPATSTPAAPPDAPAPSETAHDPDTPAGDDTPDRRDASS
jgi:hypothetical protein